MRDRQRFRPSRRWRLPLPYVVFALVVPVNLALPTYPGAVIPVTVASFLTVQFIALAFSIRVATHRGLDARTRRPWWFIVASFPPWIAFGPAMTVSGAMNGSDEVNAALLFAVFCRLASVALLLAALLSFAASPLGPVGRRKLALDLTTVVGAGTMLTWYFQLGPLLEEVSADTLANADVLTAIFPTVDLMLLFGVSTVLLRRLDTRARRSVRIVLVAAILYTIGDVGITELNLDGQSLAEDGDSLATVAVNLLLLTPSFLIGAAAVAQLRQIAEQDGTAVPAGAARPVNWLPYAALVGGYGLLAGAAFAEADFYPWSGLVLGAVVMTVGVTLRQVFALRENHAMAVTDSLTGLANRVRLRHMMARETARGRSGSPIAVLVLDLDGFKQVNDTLGHEAGDELLVAFADILRRVVRQTDTAARLGGDEFAVLLSPVDDEQHAVAVAQRIIEGTRRPVRVAGRLVSIRVSVGVAYGNPASGRIDPAELTRRADRAMYVAKRRKTIGWHLSAGDGAADHRTAVGLVAPGVLETDESTVVETDEPTAVELDDPVAAPLAEDLRRARAAGAARVVYQPMVDLDSGLHTAVEARIAWRHPVRGELVSPTFFGLSAQRGVPDDLGCWALDEASRQIRRWQGGLPSGRTLWLSIKVPARELTSTAAADGILRCVTRAGLDPRHLIVEITERAASDGHEPLTSVPVLRERGVRIALDVVGVGHGPSPEAHRRLPVDVVKLGTCFVPGTGDDGRRSVLATAVVRLGKALRWDEENRPLSAGRIDELLGVGDGTAPVESPVPVDRPGRRAFIRTR